MDINNFVPSEFLDSHNIVIREGEATVSPSTIFTVPSRRTSPATATIAPPLTRTNLSPEVTVTVNSPATHLNDTAMQVMQRTAEERMREYYSRTTREMIDENTRFPTGEWSSSFFSGAQDSFRYTVDRNDRFFDLESIRPSGTRISEELPNTMKIKVATPSLRISNGNDLVKFLKEKVELKLNGVKTDTTIELTISLNLVDTGEEIISTQEVIELD